VEFETRLFRIEATYDNKDALLKPGMIAKVKVPIEEIKDAIFIPAYTIKYLHKKATVFLYEGKSSKPIKVKLGAEINDRVEIVEGLKLGDMVEIK